MGPNWSTIAIRAASAVTGALATVRRASAIGSPGRIAANRLTARWDALSWWTSKQHRSRPGDDRTLRTNPPRLRRRDQGGITQAIAGGTATGQRMLDCEPDRRP